MTRRMSTVCLIYDMGRRRRGGNVRGFPLYAIEFNSNSRLYSTIHTPNREPAAMGRAFWGGRRLCGILPENRGDFLRAWLLGHAFSFAPLGPVPARFCRRRFL